jgi:anion-transporting  ArsA/GET3 family ATPase
MDAARDLFHDKDRSQFIIVTIPTIMAAAESARLAASLRQEGIPLETLVVNQVSPGDKKPGRSAAFQALSWNQARTIRKGGGGGRTCGCLHL